MEDQCLEIVLLNGERYFIISVVLTCTMCSRSSVQIVSSTRSGMGKSLYVQRMAEGIRGCNITCIPVHGPDVTSDAIMKLLKDDEHTNCTIFHIDVAPNVRLEQFIGTGVVSHIAQMLTCRFYIKCILFCFHFWC